MKFIALFTIFCIFSVSSKQDVAQPQINIQKCKLNNGIEVILCEDFKSPVVLVGIIWHVGALDNPVNQYGITNIISNNILSEKSLEAMYCIGAMCTTHLSDTDTSIVAEVSSKKIKQFFDIVVSDTCKIDIRNLDVYKKHLILCDKMHRYRYSNCVPLEIITGIQDHYPKNNIVFNEKELMSITKQQVCDFFHKHYNDAPISIVVIGAIGRKQLMKILHLTMGSLPQRAIKPHKNCVKTNIKKNVTIENQFMHYSLSDVIRVSMPKNTKKFNSLLWFFYHEMHKFFTDISESAGDVSLSQSRVGNEAFLKIHFLLGPYYSIAKVISEYSVFTKRFYTTQYTAEYLKTLANIAAQNYKLTFSDSSAAYNMIKELLVSNNGEDVYNIFPTLEDLQSISPEDLQQFYNDIRSGTFLRIITKSGVSE